MGPALQHRVQGNMRFQSDHYFEASKELRQSAYWLIRNDRFVAAIYFAGLAVECLLRAYRMRSNPQFDQRHDLSDLYKASGIVDFIR